MRWVTLSAVVALAAWALTAGTVFAQPSTINLNVPGPADWNTAANWIIPNVVDLFVPGDGFPDEIVGISNAGVAELNAPALFPVRGVVIGETHDPSIPNPTEEVGTLNIASNGLTLTVTEAMRIGDAGRGVLNFSGGGVTAQSLALAGAADSELNLSGNALLAISETAGLNRTVRVTGPNVTFDVEGSLQLGGTLVPVITGPTHSTITATTGTANLSGVLRPEFSGYSPNLGDSWTLIDAANITGSLTLDASQLSALPRGATFDVAHDEGGSGDVVLSLSNRLILNVHRTTGAASIENAIGDSIEIHGYTVGSPGGFLDAADGAWQSLEDSAAAGWREANPDSNFLNELNPTDSSTLAAGSSLAIGNPYSFNPTALAQAGDDVTFEYLTSDGQVFTGIVEYSGPHNNLVLSVDPMTGDAALTNESTFAAEVIGYTVASPSGSLLPGDGNWNSLEDQMIAGWREAAPSSFFLNELNPTASNLLTTGTMFQLGNIFDVAGPRDLTLEFLLLSGEVLDGVVEYREIPEPGQVGDTNGDGFVNIDDLNNVRNNFGAMGLPDGTLSGDAIPFDGVVNIDDLNGVRNNFGAGPGAVPEPSAFLLAMAAIAIGWTTSRHNRRRV